MSLLHPCPCAILPISYTYPAHTETLISLYLCLLSGKISPLPVGEISQSLTLPRGVESCLAPCQSPPSGHNCLVGQQLSPRRRVSPRHRAQVSNLCDEHLHATKSRGFLAYRLPFFRHQKTQVPVFRSRYQNRL